jgi:hypothetical protein
MSSRVRPYSSARAKSFRSDLARNRVGDFTAEKQAFLDPKDRLVSLIEDEFAELNAPMRGASVGELPPGLGSLGSIVLEWQRHLHGHFARPMTIAKEFSNICKTQSRL